MHHLQLMMRAQSTARPQRSRHTLRPMVRHTITVLAGGIRTRLNSDKLAIHRS
jgi:hypothetical protein